VPQRGQWLPVQTSRSCPQPQVGDAIRLSVAAAACAEVHAWRSVVIVLTAFLHLPWYLFGLGNTLDVIGGLPVWTGADETGEGAFVGRLRCVCATVLEGAGGCHREGVAGGGAPVVDAGSGCRCRQPIAWVLPPPHTVHHRFHNENLRPSTDTIGWLPTARRRVANGPSGSFFACTPRRTVVVKEGGRLVLGDRSDRSGDHGRLVRHGSDPSGNQSRGTQAVRARRPHSSGPGDPRSRRASSSTAHEVRVPARLAGLRPGLGTRPPGCERSAARLLGFR